MAPVSPRGALDSLMESQSGRTGREPRSRRGASRLDAGTRLTNPTATLHGGPGPRWSCILVAFVTGAIVMSFEMLGSRYLNPYFGSGIYTWAALISTVLAALTVGYFLGGLLADRTASATVLGVDRAGRLGLSRWSCRAFAEQLLEFVLADIDDVRAGSLRCGARHPVLPGHASRHVFAVRDPAAAALARSARARCPARSTASRPPAPSSARSAPPSS